MTNPRLGCDAPVLCIDVAPYELYGCDECDPWHAEIFTDDEGGIFVREWHAVDCPVLTGFFDRMSGDAA